ncbi:MAG: murein hydrolase activator EnvC family protein [Actinomycetota bacterium]
MRQRLERASLVGVILCTLLVPNVGSSAGGLESKRSALDRVEADVERLEGATGSIRSRINGLNNAITKLQIEVNRLDSRIAEIESDLRTEQAKIDRTQARIDRVEDRATDQAVSLYMNGHTETLDALLNVASIAELNDRIEMFGVAAKEQTGALVRFHRLRLTIEAQKADLFAKKRGLESVKSDRVRVLSKQNEVKSKLQKELAALNLRLGAKRDREHHLEREIAEITNTIQELQAKRAAESLGTSAQGFIWPLNGAVTSGYGERWGRMHTGIDIDGYSGQPIVASKDGVVIMSSYYSGYGNTVILDHGGGISTLYAHMSGFAVTNGAAVEQGEVVGYVGCTGSCTGDHLHFEVRVNGNPVDPMDYLP